MLQGNEEVAVTIMKQFVGTKRRRPTKENEEDEKNDKKNVIEVDGSDREEEDMKIIK